MNENIAYHTIRTKRVSTFKRIVIILGILVLLLGLSGVLFEQIQLKSTKYANAVSSDRLYIRNGESRSLEHLYILRIFL